MVKQHICISIDSDLIEKFKLQENNISKAISDLIQSSLNYKDSQISYNDKQILNIEYEKAKKEQFEAINKFKQLEENLINLENKTSEEKLNILKLKQEEEQNAIRCVKCKNITFEHNRKKMRDGFMCRVCFDTMTIDDLRIFG